jgi:hypothetical protein
MTKVGVTTPMLRTLRARKRYSMWKSSCVMNWLRLELYPVRDVTTNNDASS